MRGSILLFCTLLLASPALAQTEVSGQPTGEGDPEEVVCRRPMPIPNQRLMGPRVCKKNAVWAQYAEDGMMVSEDGTRDIPATKSTQNCRAQAGGGGGGTSMARGMGSVVCE
jgi:hypothetical protein